MNEIDTTTSIFNATNGKGIHSNIIFSNAITGGAMTMFTFCGQILVFVIIRYDKRLQTPNNYYVISLASADLLIALISMPVWTIFTALNYWPFSQLLCDIWNSLDHVLCLISIHTIVFISIERYKSVSSPLKHRVILTATRMKTCLAIIWIANWIFWFLYIFSTEYLYGKDRNPLDCSASYLKSPIFAIGFGSLGLSFPVFVTAVVYIFIFRIARRSGIINTKSIDNQQTETVSETSDCASVDTISTVVKDPGLSTQTKVEKKTENANADYTKITKEDKDRKALRTIALLLATFAVCWLPLGTIFIIEGIAPGYLDAIWTVVGYWLGYANSMLNPLCYAIGNPYFRETFSKLLFRCRR